MADSVAMGFMWSENKHFLLTNDITDAVSVRIGFNNYVQRFHGYFNGNEKKITVFLNNASLFHDVSDYGIIENLSIDGTIIIQGDAGGIVGNNYGLVQNCTNYATIQTCRSQSISYMF